MRYFFRIQMTFDQTLKEVRACTLCRAHLPLGPRPIVRGSPTARILIIGQAPGTKVHASGIPWDDASGKRLRAWMGVEPELFYDERLFAIVPMGFCYPGKGKSGDLPPRPECAPKWHETVLAHMPKIELTLLIGQYAQDYYLTGKTQATLGETVRAFREYAPDYIPLVHPSPRNQLWLKKNPWFEKSVVAYLRKTIREILG